MLKYFSFLCQFKGHDASNKLVMKDLDMKTDSWKIQKPCACVYVRLVLFFKLEAFFLEN